MFHLHCFLDTYSHIVLPISFVMDSCQFALAFVVDTTNPLLDVALYLVYYYIRKDIDFVVYEGCSFLLVLR